LIQILNSPFVSRLRLISINQHNRHTYAIRAINIINWIITNMETLIGPRTKSIEHDPKKSRIGFFNPVVERGKRRIEKMIDSACFENAIE
jgi:hypothetical protein